MATYSKLLLVCGELLWAGTAQAQVRYTTQDKVYIQAVEMGLACLKDESYKPCLAAYQKAFTISQKSALSKLRAAFCACQCQQQGLARQYIQQAITIDYEGVEGVWIDRQSYPELDRARSSQMQLEVAAVMEQKEAQAGINSALKKRLAAIHESDQRPRLELDSIQRTYGHQSPQMQQLWQRINQTDSLNRLVIEKIIGEYGYPGKRLVGAREMNTVWLVIQHSPLKSQEKYLPLIRQAAGANEMDRSNLALLIDRIRMRKGQKQLYGTQLTSDTNGTWSFHPIDEKGNVNERRWSVGLGPIKAYAREIGVQYKPTKAHRQR